VKTPPGTEELERGIALREGTLVGWAQESPGKSRPETPVFVSIPNNAVEPVPNTQKDFYDWQERRRQKQGQVRERGYDLIFIGDSITHLFEVPLAGGAVWGKYFGKYEPLDLGYGWDCTQNVLWRLGNGEFEGQTPKLVVLNIGTNNLTGNSGGRANTATEIAEGIEAILDLVHERSPATMVLVMGIFPRGARGDALRHAVKELNGELERRLKGRSGVVFLDIGESFLGEDGEIPKDVMPDGVHPAEKGYLIWAERIAPVVRRYVGRCPD